MLSSEGAFVGECFRQTTRTDSMVIGSTPKANTFPDLSFEPEAMACRGFKGLPANLGFPANLEPDRRWRWPRDRAIAKDRSSTIHDKRCRIKKPFRSWPITEDSTSEI